MSMGGDKANVKNAGEAAFVSTGGADVRAENVEGEHSVNILVSGVNVKNVEEKELLIG